MNLVTILMLIAWMLGLGTGAGLAWGIPFMRRFGKVTMIGITPEGLWSMKYDRLKDGWANAGGGKGQKSIPSFLGKVYAHQMTGRKMFLFDGNKGVPLHLDSEASRLVHPDGEALHAARRGITERNFNRDNSTNWTTIAFLGIFGFLILAGMIGWVIMNLQAANHG